MPRIFGLNLVAVTLASLAFYFVGFLWYGMLFQELWMEWAGVTDADVENENPAYMVGGFLITIMQVIGIGFVLRWKGAADIGEAIKTALVLWLLLALPFVMYAYLYMPAHNSAMLMVDASHLLVGWVVSAIILAVLK